MKQRLKLFEERIERGSHIIFIEHYDNDDLEINIFDTLGNLVEFIEIVDKVIMLSKATLKHALVSKLLLVHEKHFHQQVPQGGRA